MYPPWMPPQQPPASNNNKDVLDAISQLRQEVMAHIKELQRDASSMQLMLPRDYVMRTEFANKWQDQEHVVSEIKSDVRDMRKEHDDLANKINTTQLGAGVGLANTRANISNTALTIIVGCVSGLIVTICGGGLIALLNYILTHK